MNIEQDNEAYSSTDEDSIEEIKNEAETIVNPLCEVPPLEQNHCENQLPMVAEKEEVVPEPVKPRPRGRPRGPNYRPRKVSQTTEKVISETDDTIVVLKNRSKPAQKKRIVLYREDIQEELPIEV